jgi:hypothetical protein
MFNSGWANSCGTELFTLGWVKCAVVVVKKSKVTSVSGSAKPSLITSSYKEETISFKQLFLEDEELVSIVSLLIISGEIQ